MLSFQRLFTYSISIVDFYFSARFLKKTIKKNPFSGCNAISVTLKSKHITYINSEFSEMTSLTDLLSIFLGDNFFGCFQRLIF